MALQSALRQLALVGRSNAGISRVGTQFARGFAASSDEFTRKDVVHFLKNRDDPEVDSAIKTFLKSQYAKAEQGSLAAEKVADELEFTARVERKYVAAQIVESSIQNIPVPLGWEASGSDTSVKRYVAELLAAGEKAGLESPTAELEKRFKEGVQGIDSVKEFLVKVQASVPADFYTALVEALQEVENATGSTVTLDGASPGFKAFADKLKALATKHKIPWQLLTAQDQAGVSEEQKARAAKDYEAWVQAASVADFKAELEVLKAEAVRALDTHLSKSSEQIRQEQQASMAAFVKKLEANKKHKWAATMLEDLKNIQWFDDAVAADPKNGPVAVASA